MSTRIKICGITRMQDAQALAGSGADAMGMIFYDKSPRHVAVEDARALVCEVAPFVTTVAVVVDPSDDQLSHIVHHVSIDRVQFHGGETQRRCARAGRPYIKALRIRAGMHINRLMDEYHDASAFLLDTYVEHELGGTGRTFNWDLLEDLATGKPVILAGGLNIENVYDAIVKVNPYAVDVSSAVEIKPGIKDAVKINEFIIAVREASR